MQLRMLAVPFVLLLSAGLAVGEEGPAILSSEPLEIAEDADPLQVLLVERLNAAVLELKYVKRMYESGIVSFGDLIEPAKRVRDSGLELSDDTQNQVAWLERFLELARFNEAIVERRIQSGSETQNALQTAKYLRLDTEIMLLRLKRKAEKEK
ncbi:hypothetical protein LOC68_09130 [Blastopirellula sp. JC732]|uniref:Uncharacterized protein n=1 Tax=Blastopirellula sediminis TaxID=2894196 RepID=A0A9X1SFP4_9BACT|nr:hypothetical protein [Blastopirellula sediminis]MCC9608665.1 hypothetical protein [Blastopirellula sediminis]MCC9628558.1 hypothetical protein [Blastopirellula sediminis]